MAAPACILPTAEQPLRVAEFDSLLAAALTEARRLDETHARLTLLRGRDLAQRVLDLTTQETACCSFFTFVVDFCDAADGWIGVHVDVAVPTAQTPVLEALIARAVSVGTHVVGDS